VKFEIVPNLSPHLEHPPGGVPDPVQGHPVIAKIGLARAYALEGDMAKAKTAYSGFPGSVERRRPRHPRPEASEGGLTRSSNRLP